MGHIVGQSERAFRDWEAEQQKLHDEAVRGLYKVRRPSGEKLFWFFMIGTASICLVVGAIYGFIEFLENGLKRAFGY